MLHRAAESFGDPASFLTDNGPIFSTQRHHGVAGVTEQELFALGIEAEHSSLPIPRAAARWSAFTRP